MRFRSRTGAVDERTGTDFGSSSQDFDNYADSKVIEFAAEATLAEARRRKRRRSGERLVGA